MKSERKIIGISFKCQICEKEWVGKDDDVTQRAYHHAYNTGHYVSGEIIRQLEYNKPRSRRKKK